MTIKQKFCGFLGHNWTSLAEQGIPPTKKQIEKGVEGFKQYAAIYCTKCNYKPNHKPDHK